MEDFVLQGGVDTEFIKWLPLTAWAAGANGLNFTERGFGVRGAVGVSDRGHSAASRSRPAISTGTTFWQTGRALVAHRRHIRRVSDTTPQLFIEAVKKARQYGAIVCYDLNYRPSLWKSIGGQSARSRSTGKSPDTWT